MAEGEAHPYAVEKARDVVAAHQTSVTMALEAGIDVIAGTDAGAPGMPHPSLIDEIEMLVRYGVQPLEALKAATSRAADAVGAQGVGRIEVGSVADLAFIDGDPLSDPAILRSVWGVVKQQQLLHPARSSHEPR